MAAGRSIKRLDAGASTAIENCTLTLTLILTQVNHVKSIEGNDESTDTKTEQRADRDWLSIVFTRSFTRRAPKIS